MLSIIICNYNKSRVIEINNNISEKIGDIEYEVIFIDNSENKYSIFEAYNNGVKRSKGQDLLFIHDDIEFHTPKFGEIILALDLPNLGVLGIAGSKIKTNVTAPWWISNHENVPNGILFQSNVQNFKMSKAKTINVGFYKPKQIEEVILVDGVFMYTKKNNCLDIPFDEVYDSFHFYDLDFSMSMIANGKRNYVSNLILIEHFSCGSLNSDWLRSSFIFKKKWQKGIYNLIDYKNYSLFEKLALNSQLKVAVENKSYLAIIKLLLSFSRYIHLGRNLRTLKSIL
jgi:hypothetical protein